MSVVCSLQDKHPISVLSALPEMIAAVWTHQTAHAVRLTFNKKIFEFEIIFYFKMLHILYISLSLLLCMLYVPCMCYVCCVFNHATTCHSVSLPTIGDT